MPEAVKHSRFDSGWLADAEDAAVRAGVWQHAYSTRRYRNEIASVALKFPGESEMPTMPVFFFDVRDGEKFTVDEQGLTFNGIEGARDEATRALAEMAKQVFPGPTRQRVAIEVRGEAREPALVVALMFEAAPASHVS